jgi:8-oxo-dGTP pyrophosphatase MutT (NUDIX family)
VIPQAGAIAFRSASQSAQVLLVRSKHNPHWIFPKGHVEPGETATQAALRELGEEAAVTGDLVGHVGVLDRSVGADVQRVEYYLFRYSHDVSSGEARLSRWCGCDEALRLLPSEEAREILRRARPLMEVFPPRADDHSPEG